MSFYHSENKNRLVLKEQDDLFYKTNKTYDVKGIVLFLTYKK
jgi:hypothetical protein